MRPSYVLGTLVKLILSVITASLLCCDTAYTQEMRVYTLVRNLAVLGENEPVDKAPVVARSLTLFRAGKVYDYVDTAQEVTVFEPTLGRFVLHNEKRATKTEVSQSEIRQFLKLFEHQAGKTIEEVSTTSTQGQIKALGWLKFQLQPEFKTTFDSAKSRMTLLATEARYEVEVMEPQSGEAVDTYLKFADAMAELNSVLHPRLLPAPRLKLNEALRNESRLPLTVELRADIDAPLRLQARHQWTWELSSTDRQLISKWERELQSTSVRQVNFRQYQQESLGSEVVSKK